MTITNDLTINKHIKEITRQTTFQLINLYKIRKSLTLKTTQQLNNVLMFTKLEYCSSLLNNYTRKCINLDRIIKS